MTNDFVYMYIYSIRKKIEEGKNKQKKRKYLHSYTRDQKMKSIFAEQK